MPSRIKMVLDTVDLLVLKTGSCEEVNFVITGGITEVIYFQKI